MNNSWLKELKVGEKVFVSKIFVNKIYGNKMLGTVQRVTPTGRVVVNDTQYINGVHHFDKWRVAILEEATDEKIEEYKIKNFIQRVFNELREKKSMTYEQAKKINEILELGVEE